MEFQFRPLGDWSGPSTVARSWPRFKAAYQDTLDLLLAEAEKLAAKRMVSRPPLPPGSAAPSCPASRPRRCPCRLR
jgi:hypothetical protein